MVIQSQSTSSSETLPVNQKSEENARDGWPGLPNQRFVRNADAPRRRACFGVSRNQTKMPARSAFGWHFLLEVERTDSQIMSARYALTCAYRADIICEDVLSIPWAVTHPLHFLYHFKKYPESPIKPIPEQQE